MQTERLHFDDDGIRSLVPKDFGATLSVYIIRYWDSETTEQLALGAMRGEN